MVFESVLAEVLNLYIGDYVENLDRSQLKIGIWGGDIVLQNLVLKQSVLDELHLPLKTVFGHLGKLILKIPWKNLYNAPVVASVEGLFLLVVPNVEEQDHFLSRMKQAELQRLEIAKKFKKETAKTKSSDTFVEKLATQIIRNVQIKIRDIHIRYEDELSCSERPFSIGITLHNLSVQTTNPKEGIVQDASTIFYKNLNLEGLAVYMNCNPQMFGHENDPAECLKLFERGISTKVHLAEGFEYVLGPINLSAKLQLNPRPEDDGSGFNTPKILLILVMEQLAIGISRTQYCSFVAWMEFFNQLNIKSAFRKNRPKVPRCKGHYKEWWKFAMRCVLEQQGYKSQVIGWESVIKHRSKCRSYAAAYRKKLQDPAEAAQIQYVLEECEEALDVFNIMLVRQQVEAELEWLERQKKSETKTQSMGSWFSSWFGFGSSKNQDKLAVKFKDELTEEERLKLYQAIDYQENALPTSFPAEFVETKIHFRLNGLTVDVRDNAYNPARVLLAELTGVSSVIQRRPTANAIKVMLSMGHLSVSGTRQGNVTPQLISSRMQGKENSVLVDALFETNPLEGDCDQRIRMHALPLQLAYDAYTINRIVKLFQIPHSSALAQLQAMAGSRLSALKEISAVGLQHAIEQYIITDIEIDLMSSYVILPYKGFYGGKEDLLIVNLGRLSVNTVPRDGSLRKTVDHLHKQGLSGDHMRDKRYDQFIVELKDVQVLMVLAGEDWEKVLVQPDSSAMHLLEPASLTVSVEKCLVKHDAALPNLKVVGNLPSITFTIEENRLVSLIMLYRSIPFPNLSGISQDVGSRLQNDAYIIDDENEAGEEDMSTERTEVDLKFELGGLRLLLYKPCTYSRGHMSGPVELQKIIDICASHLEMRAIKRTFHTVMTIRLGGVILKYNGPEGTLMLIDPSISSGRPQDILSIQYRNVDEKSPDFASKYGSIQQLIVADFNHLGVQLHQEALVALYMYVNGVSQRLEKSLGSSLADKRQEEEFVLHKKSKRSMWQGGGGNSVLFRMKACMHKLSVCLLVRRQPLAYFFVEGLEAVTSVSKPCTEVIARLKNVSVLGPSPKSPHHKILSIVGNEALRTEIVFYNHEKGKHKNAIDMSIKAEMACSRIVFLSSFISSITDFFCKFHKAQENLSLAMAEAAQAARQSVLKVHAKAKFIQLNISLKAPLIVVPINAASLDAMHMDFGCLTIRNKCMMLSSDETNRIPTVDTIQLDLKNLQLSRVILSPTADIVSEHKLVPPISFLLQVTRNLSVSWYTKIPDVTMVGRLDNAQLSLGLDDVRMVMRILSENFAKSTSSTEAVVKASKPSPGGSKKSNSSSQSQDFPPRSISWKLKLNMTNLKVLLGLKAEESAEFIVSGLDVTFCEDSNFQMGFRIRDFTVTDLSSSTTHQKVLAVEGGEEALSASVLMYDRRTQQDGIDMFVTAQMARIRVIFLIRFFSSMMEFLNTFKEVPGDLVDAVAEAAKQGVLQAQSTSKRISLNIDLKAPIIIVPAHQNSSDALLMDFGNLTLRNKFLSVSNSASGQNAVVDELNVGLHNLKISRVKLNPRAEIVSECWLLQPVDFFLQVKRNLCIGEYRDMPDVEVKGHIKSVVVAGNQDDIKMVLSVMSQNLTGSKEPLQNNSPGSVASAPSRVGKKSVSLSSAPVNIPVQFTFTMDSLVVELFDEDVMKVLNLASVHLAENSLGRFTLSLFALKGMQYFDGSIDITVLLVDCWLDDTRKNSRSRLSRLMERKTEASTATPLHVVDLFAPFHVPKNVEIIYKKKGLQTEVNIRIFSFNLILNMEYLTKLSRFLTITFSANEGWNSSVKFQPQLSENLILTTGKMKEESANTVTIINLHAEKPDIFLVEDMEDLNTSALLLRSEINCSLYHGSNAVNVKGSIKEFQLYSCCYNPNLRQETMSQILLPCSIQVEGSTSQFSVSCTNIRLRVSPGTIELLTRVMRAVYSRESGAGDNGDTIMDLSNLWSMRSLQEVDHWFLRKDCESGVMELRTASYKQNLNRSEKCILQAPSITITMEAGIGCYTLPMILLNVGLNATIHDWSSQLSVKSTLSLQMSYYNSYLAVWEPVIEPVETVQNGTVHQTPWKLSLKAEMIKRQQQKTSQDLLGDWDYIPNDPSTMEITITSKDSLELVVTKTGLDVLNNFTKAHRTALEGGLMSPEGPASPYIVKNNVGLPITLLLAHGQFRVYKGEILSRDSYTMAPGECVGLCMDDGFLHSSLSLLEVGHTNEKFLKIHVHQMECFLDLPVVQTNTRYFSLHDTCGLISDVRIECGRTIVTLRSILQIYNYLGEPLDVHCRTNRGYDTTYVGTVAPGEHLNLPLFAVYTATNELFFSIPGFSVISCLWTEIIKEQSSTQYQCMPEQSSQKEPCYVRVICSMDQAYYETGNTKVRASSFYRLEVRPPIVIKNLLPVSLTCSQPGTTISKVLGAGEQLQLATAKPGSSVVLFQINKYRESSWISSHKIVSSPSEFNVLQFKNNQNHLLGLGIHTEQKHGSMVICLYSPFWFLNKTGLPLSYWKSDDSREIPFHPSDVKNAVLFPSFSSNKKAAIRVDGGQWSDRFSIDVAGNSGIISCTAGRRLYKIGVHVHLTHATLIKQVTFTPYYVLVNNCNYNIECQEAEQSADPWFKVKSGDCSALWPYQPNEKVALRARVSGTLQLTPSFMCSTVHTTLLRLNNKFGGLNVDVQITEGAVYITFTSYEPGQAPALIINHSWMTIPITEKGSENVWLINPGEEMLFTWTHPRGPRQLEWCPDVDQDVCKLSMDGSGSFYPVHNILIHWRSFLDGPQRVLLFSSDKTATQNLQDSTQVLQKVTLMIYGLGLSLVNNITHTELLYICITRKPTKLRDMKSKTSTSTRRQSHSIDSDAGLWLEAKILPYEVQLHAKVHNLQIDNQLPDCMYPVMLARVPPPRTVAANNAIPKPFAEMCVIRHSMKHSSLQQFKYFKVLVQEFHIRMDMGLVNALFTMLEAGQVSDDVEAAQFLEDRSLVGAGLRAHVALHSSQGQKNFFDYLHFSPLMIHLSFSLGGGSGRKGQDTPHALRVLLRSLGVALTDVQDVVFKLAYFERRNTFLNYQQLASEAVQHYKGQALKQFYVFVLGLDIIGNPYGLVVGLTQGVEDLFYEPFRGAIQGPGEFAEGIVLGVKSLLGHTVGGAAGAMSRITGAMGKGVAALTFDEEYQRKRQETLSQRPTNVQTGLARSGKGLVMGIADGVTGVFTKPISGAKKEGVEGFFKGVGKGVVGLVARPTAGIIDFASGSLDAVKRTTDTSVEVERQRPPRFAHQDGQVRPYIRAEAEGQNVLEMLDNRQIATGDNYECHVVVVPGKTILMLTDKRILYLSYIEIFGKWKIEWEHPWGTLSGPPVIQSSSIFIPVNRISYGADGREVPIWKPEQQRFVVEKAKVLMKY